MRNNGFITTVRVSTRTGASRAAVYAVLADLSTHLVWGGEETGDKRFRLLTMELTSGAAVTGTRFASTGLIPMGTFHDETVVTAATPPARLDFHTQSVLERKRRDSWRGTFDHRYMLESDGGETIIRYEVDLYATNYVPWWWRLPMRPMTRTMVGRTMTRCLRSLARIADASQQTVPAATQARDAAAAG